jgi:arabinofuranosyltransferase
MPVVKPRGPAGREPAGPVPPPAWAVVLGLALPLLALILLSSTMQLFWGFVQDDAFISLRYARNLTAGYGLVFNPGERVEGFTNLSWTLLEALWLALGLPALEIMRLVGGAAALALVVLVWVEAGGASFGTSPGRSLAAALAALLLASNATLAVWSAAGLEEAFFTLLVFGGYRAFVRHRDASASVLWLLATATRPEGALAFGLGVVVRGSALLLARKRPSRAELGWGALYVAGLAALEAFRLAYYGSAVPNTFYVKGTASTFTHLLGLAELGKFLAFGAFGVVLAAAVLGLAVGACAPPRSRPGARERSHGEDVAFSTLFLLSFLYYMVRVGGDQLPLFRLYMPVLPFAVLWAVRAVQWTWELGARECEPVAPRRAFRAAGRVVSLALAAALAGAIAGGVRAALAHADVRRVTGWLDAAHGAAGRFLEDQAARQPPGRPLTVLAQDIGLTPYVASSVRFVDVFGLTDRVVATTLHRYDYNPYTRGLMWADPASRGRIEAMELELRAYLESRAPDYVLITVNCRPEDTEAVRAASARRDAAYFKVPTGRNPLYYGLPSEPRFLDEFELVRGYEYSPICFVLLYQRKAAGPGPSSPRL